MRLECRLLTTSPPRPPSTAIFRAPAVRPVRCPNRWYPRRAPATTAFSPSLPGGSPRATNPSASGAMPEQPSGHLAAGGRVAVHGF